MLTIYTLMFCCFVQVLVVQSAGKLPIKQPAATSSSSNVRCQVDYFVLAIHYPVGRDCRSSIIGSPSLHYAEDVKRGWFIHGLWPQSNYGSLKNCKNCPAVRYNVPTWPNEDKEDPNMPKQRDMVEKWSNLKVNRDGTTDDEGKFWKNEYENHASCAVRFSGMNSQKKYFQKALDLFDRVNPATKIPHNIRHPNGAYELAQLQTTIQTQITGRNNYVAPKCCARVVGNNNPTTVTVLQEIKFCFDVHFKFISCPQSMRGNADCNRVVTVKDAKIVFPQ